MKDIIISLLGIQLVTQVEDVSNKGVSNAHKAVTSIVLRTPE